MNFWLRKSSGGDSLVVSMAGVKLGERVLVLGARDATLIAGVGTKSGLTGRTCIFAESDEAVRAAVARAEADGALVDGASGPWSTLPFDEASFDVVLVRDVLPPLSAAGRAGCLSEVKRVLRPGGRVVVMDTTGARLLAGLLGTDASGRFYTQEGGAATALEAQGFKAVRPLAERDGLVFTEGARPAN